MQPTPEQHTHTSQWLGRAASPLVSLGNSIRESRVFQPNGICFHAEVSPKRGLPSHFRNLANRLSGDALVRLSGGLWQAEHRLLPDVLNCSIRFKAEPLQDEPSAEAQDLILLSTRTPWALAIDSLKTNQHDFLLNDYHSLAPFEIDGRSNISLRLIPQVEPGPGHNREEKIRAAVNASDVRLDLQIRENDRGTEWKPLLEIRLRREVQLSAEQLHFWPFRAGQGIRPQGWLEYLRPIPDLLDRLQNDTAGDSNPRGTARQSRTAPNRLGQTIAEATVQAANLLQSSLDQAFRLAGQARDATSSLLRQILRTTQTSAADATMLAAVGTETVEQTLQQASEKAQDTTRENLRKTRQASRRATQRVADRAVELGNRAGETVARASAEVQDTAQDIRTSTAKAGSRIAEQAGDTAKDIRQRTRQAATTLTEDIKGEPNKPRRRRSKARPKAEPSSSRPH